MGWKTDTALTAEKLIEHLREIPNPSEDIERLHNDTLANSNALKADIEVRYGQTIRGGTP